MTDVYLTTIEGYTVSFTRPERIYDNRFAVSMGLLVDGRTVMTREARVHQKLRPLDGLDSLPGEIVLELHKLVRDYEARVVQEILTDASKEPDSE